MSKVTINGLNDLPTITEDDLFAVQSGNDSLDYKVTLNSIKAHILQELPNSSISGSYNDLTDLPALGTVSNRDVGTLSGQVPLTDSLSTVAFSGSYNDLSDLPAVSPDNFSVETSSFVAQPYYKYFSVITNNNINVTLPNTLIVGSWYYFKNSQGSLYNLIVDNPSFTITGNASVVSAGDNISVSPDKSLYMVATATDKLEIL